MWSLTCGVSVLRESALNATTVSMDAIQYDGTTSLTFIAIRGG